MGWVCVLAVLAWHSRLPLPPKVSLMDALELFSAVLDQTCSVPIVAHIPCQCWPSHQWGFSATEQERSELTLIVDQDRCWGSHRKLARVLGCLSFCSALFQHVHALHEYSPSFSHYSYQSHWSSEQSMGTHPVADPIALLCGFKVSLPMEGTHSMNPLFCVSSQECLPLPELFPSLPV